MFITSPFSTRQSPSLLINGSPFIHGPDHHQEALAPPSVAVKGQTKQLHSLSSVTATALSGAMAAESSPFKLIVGSASSARRQIVADMGYEFTVMTADIDEKAIRKDKPEELVMAIAEAKADAVISKLQTLNRLKESETTVLISADTAAAISPKLPIDDYTKDVDPTLLITADQVVVYDGVVREKPSSEEEAREFIKGYSGRQASTVSSVVVTNLKTGARKGDWDRVEILFHEIPDEVIDKLIEEGTVLYVAGGLIIEHPLVLPLVKQMIGTTDSVMGLPKDLTEKLINEVL